MLREKSDMSDIEWLEKEIEKLAKEISIDDKHVQRFFDGTYRGVSFTKYIKGKRIVLLARVYDNATGKVNYPIIKSTDEDNYEVITKMEKLARLIRVYIAFRKAEEMITKAREDLKALMS